MLDNLLEDGSAMSQHAAIREILVLCQQGMGGLQDVVLQNSSGVLPVRRDLDVFRRRLFEEVHGHVG